MQGQQSLINGTSEAVRDFCPGLRHDIDALKNLVRRREEGLVVAPS